MDLTGYEAKFSHNGLAWTWEVTTPDGDVLHADMGSIARESAEKAALTAIKRHAGQPAPMTGAELQAAVTERETE